MLSVGEGNKPGATSGVSAPAQTSKPVKQPNQKKDSSNVVPEKKRGDKPPEKDRKKDVPPPRMQFDDKSRVEKAKKRSVVKQTEARNRVELFRHLPQYERENQLSDLESKCFQLDNMHPAVYKVCTVTCLSFVKCCCFCVKSFLFKIIMNTSII